MTEHMNDLLKKHNFQSYEEARDFCKTFLDMASFNTAPSNEGMRRRAAMADLRARVNEDDFNSSEEEEEEDMFERWMTEFQGMDMKKLEEGVELYKKAKKVGSCKKAVSTRKESEKSKTGFISSFRVSKKDLQENNPKKFINASGKVCEYCAYYSYHLNPEFKKYMDESATMKKNGSWSNSTKVIPGRMGLKEGVDYFEYTEEEPMDLKWAYDDFNSLEEEEDMSEPSDEEVKEAKTGPTRLTKFRFKMLGSYTNTNLSISFETNDGKFCEYCPSYALENGNEEFKANIDKLTLSSNNVWFDPGKETDGRTDINWRGLRYGIDYKITDTKMTDAETTELWGRCGK